MNKYLKKGFSLTELSVSLAIIAMIVGSAISVALNNDFSVKKEQTLLKLKSIEEALIGFFVANKRLPCPADGEDAILDPEFGVEKIQISSNPAQCNVTLASGQTFQSGRIQAGVVPVTTLQLPDEFMFDGWGRRITYAVDMNFINNENTNDKTAENDCLGNECFIDTASGSITINNGLGDIITDKAVYVLLSFGENGHGAFLKEGSDTRFNSYGLGIPFSGNTPASEEENAHFTNGGANTSYNEVYVAKDFIKSDTDYFDDIVKYKLRSQIVKDGGGYFYDTDCRAAYKINENIGSSDNNDCYLADDQDMCENLATKFVTYCIAD